LLQPPAVDDGDHVGQRQRLRLVVGDIDEGDAGAPLQHLELGAHALAQLGVEIGQGLVEQQDLGLDHEAARQRHALLLAARQLVGIALLEPGEIDQRERLFDLAPRLGARDLAHLEAEDDVFEHGLVRPYRVVLEHHAHTAGVRRHHLARRREEPSVHHDGAGVGHDIAGDQSQRGRLAAAARAQQGDELVVLDVEVEIGHSRHIGIVRAEMLRQPLDGDARHYATAPSRPPRAAMPPPPIL
jgi:hypothetical protein